MAGADGNVSKITLPAIVETHMSEIGIFYPDGRETQKSWTLTLKFNLVLMM